MKKIGMLWDTEYPKEIRIQSESERLIKEGFYVTVFCLAYSSSKSGTMEEEIYNGVKIQRYYVSPLCKKIQFTAYTVPIYHLLIRKSIKRFIESNSFDILHFHNMYILGAFKMLKLPNQYVFDVHENLPECFDMYKHTSSFTGKILVSKSGWKKHEKMFIEESLKTIVVTKEAAVYYHRVYNIPLEKFVICPNFMRASFQLKRNEQNYVNLVTRFSKRFNLLYIGDTASRRGLYTVLEALTVLKKIIPEINFIVLGKSKEDENYFKFVKKNNLEGHVSFEGWVEEKLFTDYITISHIGLCPLVRNIHHDTTYANKLFQYMAFGLPLLVSDCTAQKNLVEDNKIGLVHKANDKDDFVDKVVSFYKNIDIRNNFSINCIQAFSQNFNENIISKELVDFYKNLLN